MHAYQGALHEPYTPSDMAKAQQPEGESHEEPIDGPTQIKAPEKDVDPPVPPEPPPTLPRSRNNKQWLDDRLPPDLTTPIPLPRHQLSSRPLELNPDLFWSLQQKANSKWSRGFDVKGTAGVFRSLSSAKSSPAKWLPSPTPTVLEGKTILFIPSPKTILHSLKRILDAKKRNKHTAILCLVPQSLLEKNEVRTFMHAYASKGTTYAQGPLFKEVGAQHFLQLNQALHEFWIDPAGPLMPHLTPRQHRDLQKILKKYHAQLGDANTSAATRQQGAPTYIPYVRLPVRPDHTPASEPPFKKNPTVRQLTIDFVRDLLRRGLVSRCTPQEAVFVCNSLMLPKPCLLYTSPSPRD